MTRIALVRTVCKIKIKIKSLSKVSSPTLSLSLGDRVPFFCEGQSTCQCQTRRDVFHPNLDPGCVMCFNILVRWKRTLLRRRGHLNHQPIHGITYQQNLGLLF